MCLSGYVFDAGAWRGLKYASARTSEPGGRCVKIRSASVPGQTHDVPGLPLSHPRHTAPVWRMPVT